MATLVQAGTCGANASSTWGVGVSQRRCVGHAPMCSVWSRGGVRAEVDTSAAAATTATVNPSIKKDVAKVVDTVKLAELAKPLTVYCRCWRSGTFPLCDGSHDKHNKATGDNVGPLLLKK